MPLTLALLAPALLAGCPPPTATGPDAGSGSGTTPTATAPTSGETPAPAPQPNGTAAPSPTSAPSGSADPQQARWVGNWSSPNCGERKYERVINLGPDGRFSAQERVSPCPAGTQCVWSGIVAYQGSWEAKGDGVTLTVSKQDNAPGKIALASALSWSAAANAPADAADANCAYTKK